MFRILIAIGWILSKTPEPLVKVFCGFLAVLFYSVPSKRLQIIYSNLHHAFPERSPEWLRRTVKRVCFRTVEMGLFTLASPHFSHKRMQGILEVPPEVNALFQELIARKEPIVGFAAHFSMIEAYNEWPNMVDFEFPKTAVMYRPHKSSLINDLIVKHRSRTGFELVSRKKGIKRMGEVLRKKGMSILLFDQNTRDSGSLIPFFGRVTSATELPGLLAQKYKAIPVAIGCHRTDFWRAAVIMDELRVAELDAASLTLASNQWLEDTIKSSDDLLVDWLWSHNRWKILFRPFERLGMNHRKKITNFSVFPLRKTRIALLHQNIESEKGKALEFLAALRKSRPDAEITLISDEAESFQQRHPKCVDVAHDLFGEKKSDGQLAKAMRDHYLDVLMVMDDSADSLRFAKTTQVPQRFGIQLEGKKHSSLTDAWTPEDPYAWKMNPDWIPFGEYFGLEVAKEDAN